MSGKSRHARKILPALALIALIAAAVCVSDQLSARVDGARQQQLEEAIRSCAAQCYALEGSYPESLKYLEANYTLTLNRKKYVYHYKFIGSNMVPEVHVFEKKQ